MKSEDHRHELRQAVFSLVKENIDDIVLDEHTLNTEFRDLGLGSMEIIKIILGLESQGWLDISSIGVDAPPKTINELLELMSASTT